MSIPPSISLVGPSPGIEKILAGQVNIPKKEGDVPRGTSAKGRPWSEIKAEARSPAEAKPLGPSSGLDRMGAGRGEAVKAVQPRSWAKLKPKERTGAESHLLAVAASQGDLRAALTELRIDPKSIPKALQKRLLEAVNGGGK
jgi:hypothetical protein